MASKNNADVVIGGKVFRVCGYESEEYLQKVANYINGKIAEYTKEDSFRRMSPEMRANILYLNIADDYFKAKNSADQTADDNNDKEQQLYELRHEVIEAQIKHDASLKLVEEYKEQVNALQRKVVMLEAEKEKN